MSKLHSLIRSAIKHKGSQAKLAADAGCSQQQIAYLLTAKKITGDMALAIDKATDGQVSKHDLRPDLFGEKPQAEAA